jgi:hypothetical protein
MSEGIKIYGAVVLLNPGIGGREMLYEDDAILGLAEARYRIGAYGLGWIFACRPFQAQHLVLSLPGQCPDTFTGRKALPDLIQAVRDYRQRIKELGAYLAQNERAEP